MWLATVVLATAFPCKGGTPEHVAATKKLERVSANVAALDPSADPLPIWREIEDLPRGPCFTGYADERDGVEDPDSALALKTWWEHGGRSWLEWYLDAHDTTPPRRVVLPPSMRASLSTDSNGEDDLAALLCPADEKKPCGDETRGWARRARDAFRLHAFENGKARKGAHAGGHLDEVPECAGAKPEGDPPHPPEARWRAWRTCVERSRDETAALPVGRTRSPAEGWLVVRGRRGHYSFCDEVRVYDLATGAAWISQSCSGLVLRNDGSVDGKRTDAARKPKARAGRVSVDLLREAVWMTLLAPHVQSAVVEYAQWIDIPDGISPAWRDPGEGGMTTGTLGRSFWSSSAQTRLGVTWKRKGAANVERDLTWPDSADAAEDHAVSLLAIAEDSFVEGCPPAALPATVAAKTSAPGVGSLDAPNGVAGTQDALVQSLLEIAPCEPAPSR